MHSTAHQHGFERSVGHPLDDFYSTSARAAATLRVGRSLRQALARLLESGKLRFFFQKRKKKCVSEQKFRYSDLVIAGNKVHRAILEARCPKAIEIGEVSAEDQQAFKVCFCIFLLETLCLHVGNRLFFVSSTLESTLLNVVALVMLLLISSSEFCNLQR